MENQHSDSGSSAQVAIRLLGAFGVDVDGHSVTIPLSAQRVLAALACRPREQDRMVVGALLYPDGRRAQVSASLRSALWRARRDVGHALVTSRGQRLSLDDNVKVDLHTWTHRTRLLMAQPGSGINGAVSAVVDALSAELLPAWTDEWLIFERQRWDQLRLHGLEHLAERFASAGMYMDALEAALAAVAIEPYRESANRVLIRAYIAEGNRGSAVAQYHRYQRILTRELGVRPTAQLQRLVNGLTEEQAPR